MVTYRYSCQLAERSHSKQDPCHWQDGSCLLCVEVRICKQFLRYFHIRSVSMEVDGLLYVVVMNWTGSWWFIVCGSYELLWKHYLQQNTYVFHFLCYLHVSLTLVDIYCSFKPIVRLQSRKLSMFLNLIWNTGFILTPRINIKFFVCF